MKCPICSGKENLQTRIRRNLLFKLLPFSKSYKCYNCESEYLLYIFLKIPYKIKVNFFRKTEHLN